jgi:SAM-dependent methyltransferase
MPSSNTALHQERAEDTKLAVDDRAVDPRCGYDRAAPFYDAWHWQALWALNETPTIVDVLNRFTKGRVLDVGTGTGRYLELAQSLGHEVYGFDISREMLSVAARRLGRTENEPFLRIGDVCQIPFGDRLFDCALCCRVLSHVPDLSPALTEVSRVLRRGACALITDIDGRHNYEATRIPTDSGDIRIQVYKHTLADAEGIAIESGFEVKFGELVTAENLVWRPSVTNFPSIDWSGAAPIAYRLLLQKP